MKKEPYRRALSIQGSEKEPFYGKVDNFDTDSFDSILSLQGDLDRMKYGVGNKTDPWYSAFLNMSGDPLASPSYTLQGPFTTVTRNNTGSSPGTSELSHDSVASLLNALM
jgi:hypothetical protein